MQFAYNNFISCQMTRSSFCLFEFRIKKHDVLIMSSHIIGYIDVVIRILNVHVCQIEFII